MSLSPLRLVVACFALLLSAGAALAAEPSVSVGQEELELLRLINERRAAIGKQPLKLQPQLTQAAQIHSANMARHLGGGRLSHFNVTGPGDTELSRMQAAGLTWIPAAGETLSGGRSPQEVVERWVGSQIHNQIMHSEDFEYVGIAKVQDAQGYVYWTAKYASPRIEGVRGEVQLPNGQRLGATGDPLASNGANRPAPQPDQDLTHQQNQNVGGVDLSAPQPVIDFRPAPAPAPVEQLTLTITNLTPITLEIYTFSAGRPVLAQTIAAGQRDITTHLPAGAEYALRVRETGQEALRTTLDKAERFTVGRE